MGVSRIRLSLLVLLTAAAIPSHAQNRLTIPIPGRGPNFGSPVIADLDGGPAEISVTGSDGLVHAFSGDGALLWSAALPNASCTAAAADNKAGSTPAVGELLGGGRRFVVTGYGGVGGKSCGGGVAAFDGATGEAAWNFDLRAFAARAGFGLVVGHSVFSSPALADMNGDGRMEIGFGSFDRHAYLLNGRGKLRWYYQLADTTWSSGAFADVDGDGKLEFLLGSDISGNKALGTRDGGYINAFKSRVRRSRRVFHFRDRRILRWQTFLDQVVMSTPAVGDLIPDSPGLEVATLSGCFFPPGSGSKRGNWVKVLRAGDGALLRTLTTTACSSSSPALGDVNSDGLIDVVAAIQGEPGVTPSHLLAWTPSTGALLWDIVPEDQRGQTEAARGTFLSPSIADLDGNGSPDVIAPVASAIGIYNGRDGRVLALLPVPEVVQSTAAAGDVTGSGRPSLVAARSRLYIWSGFESLGSDAGSQPAHTAPWPMFRADAAHTGVIGG